MLSLKRFNAVCKAAKLQAGKVRIIRTINGEKLRPEIHSYYCLSNIMFFKQKGIPSS